MREYLKASRKHSHKSQAEIAASLGISQNYYSTIETGERQRDMTYSMMEKLAAALGVPVLEITSAETAYRAKRLNSA